MRSIFLLALVVTTCLVTCQQTPIYISRSTGSDILGTGAINSPFASFARVITNNTQQVNITILEGTYEISKPLVFFNVQNVSLVGVGRVEIFARLKNHELLKFESSSHVQVHNIIFSRGFGKNGGGALQLVNCTSCAFVHCSFLSNRGTFGGAISIRQSNDVTLNACKMEQNMAYLVESNANNFFNKIQRGPYSLLNVSNSFFVENYPLDISNKIIGGSGGALFIEESKNVLVTESVIRGSVSYEGGGATAVLSSVFFVNTLFENNTAVSASFAVHFRDSEVDMIDCAVINNKCKSLKCRALPSQLFAFYRSPIWVLLFTVINSVVVGMFVVLNISSIAMAVVLFIKRFALIKTSMAHLLQHHIDWWLCSTGVHIIDDLNIVWQIFQRIAHIFCIFFGAIMFLTNYRGWYDIMLSH